GLWVIRHVGTFEEVTSVGAAAHSDSDARRNGCDSSRELEIERCVNRIVRFACTLFMPDLEFLITFERNGSAGEPQMMVPSWPCLRAASM
ncbi:MAG TPA: hypothetical protein VFQ44_17860, partial [Streptosporangiaceae bacterium]|nr:hypothetical protein [Streptosporangiaceae bacterium]